MAAFILLVLGFAMPALAGQLTRADLERRFEPPLHVGDQARDVPVWPITSELEPQGGPVAWAFESIDLAPIPGFRHRCAYDAIERTGAIRYDDCFQCLDCVGIYHDVARCAPVLLYRRKGRTIAPRPA